MMREKGGAVMHLEFTVKEIDLLLAVLEQVNVRGMEAMRLAVAAADKLYAAKGPAALGPDAEGA
ncbi:MAG: hypothetical protein IT318_20360 [Anaerolineales bacterium]|nr:hypothetical protein [Anaerolineales bacterium]